MVQKVVLDTADNSIQVRPDISHEQVKEIANKCFGLAVNLESEIKELESYDDRNFLIEGKLSESPVKRYNDFNKFVLKIYNTSSASRYHWYENINKMVEQIYSTCAPYFKIPLPIYGLDNRCMAVLHDIPLQIDVDVIGSTLEDLPSKTNMITTKDGVYLARHMVRLTAFIPGKVLDAKMMGDELAYNYGRAAANLDLALKDYPAPTFDAQKKFVWNMLHVKDNLYDPYISSIKDPYCKQTAEKILDELNDNILPQLQQLPKQWIHGDLNDQNILQEKESREIVGIIDFDDTRYSYRAIELAIVLMYLTGTSTRERSMDLAKHAFHGYYSLIQLTEVEIDILYNLMLVRYIQSCCLSEYQYEYIDPGNEYILITSRTAKDNLEYMLSIGKERFLAKLQEKL